MPRQALAALLVALAHVRRHHLETPVSGSPGRPTLPPMVALNLLRELDTLLRHAVVEAAGPRRRLKPADRRAGWRLPCLTGLTHVLVPSEHRGFASVDLVRARLAAIGFTASDHGRLCQSAPEPGELLATLVTAVTLTDAVARRLSQQVGEPAQLAGSVTRPVSTTAN